MGRLEIAGLMLGAALITVGAGLLLWPLVLVAIGVALVGASWPRGSA